MPKPIPGEMAPKPKGKASPTHYFHMVITLPHELNPLILPNQEVLYNLLFQAASQAFKIGPRIS